MPRTEYGRFKKRMKRRARVGAIYKRGFAKRAGRRIAGTFNQDKLPPIFYFPATLPPKMRTSLKYTELVTVAGAAGVTGIQTYRGNSLYDPNVTGAGGQPYRFDQLCGATETSAMYAKYCVIGATIKVEPINAELSANEQMRLALVKYDDPTVTTLSEVLDWPAAKFSWIGSSTFWKVKPLILKGITSKMFGHPLDLDGDDGANYNANPQDIWYFSIVADSPAGATYSIYCQVTIVYDCLFYNPNHFSQS